MNTKKRNYNLDLLRIIACFMVIILHVSAYYWYNTGANTFEFNVYNFYDSLVRAAVPLFVMISGVLFLSKNEIETKTLYKKNILKLIIFYLFWSLIYYVFDYYRYNYQFNIWDFFAKLITGHYHLWFIPMLIGLYVISPILVKITQNSDLKLFKYFFVLIIIFSSLNTLSYCTFLPKYNLIQSLIAKLPVNIICEFYSYFLLGYFLYNYDISKKKQIIFYVLGILSIILCTIGTWFLSKNNGFNDGSFYSEFSIFTLFEAIALFLYFKNTNFISEKIYSDRICELSKCTLGIYAIHVIVMELLFKFRLIRITDFNPILSVPIISVVIFMFSLIIVKILRKIKFTDKFIL